MMIKKFSTLLLLGTIGSVFFISFEGVSQENSGILFASMRIKIVYEDQVCRLPNGYNSILNGERCPPLSLEYVENLPGIPGIDGRDFSETKPIKPGENITLDNNLFSALNDYYELHLREAPLIFEQRKSAIFFFTFYGEHPKLDITINAIQQNNKGCRGQIIPENHLIQNYRHTVLENEQSFFYHVAADTIIPCSRVEWRLEARDDSSNQVYNPWIFRTEG